MTSASPIVVSAVPSAPAATGRCPVCGSGRFARHKILWPKLIEAWQLAPHEVEYVDRQQGLVCERCGCSLRAMAIAAAISRIHNYDDTLARFLTTRAAKRLRILEINTAAQLTRWFATLPGHRLVQYPRYDMMALNLPDASFDLVVHSDTLEHVPNPIRALSECRRVLAPGGCCVFTVPTVVDRVTRSRDGLPLSYHALPGSAPSDCVARSEFGMDLWKLALQAGFDSFETHAIDYPAGLAYVAKIHRHRVPRQAKIPFEENPLYHLERECFKITLENLRVGGVRRLVLYDANAGSWRLLTRDAIAKFDTVMVADDKQEAWGMAIAGAPVVSPADALAAKPQAVLLSSDANENELAAKARQWVPDDIAIHRLYGGDVMKAPRRVHVLEQALFNAVIENLRLKKIERLGLYGAGAHTRRLLKEAHVKKFESFRVIDDNPDVWGQEIAGARVVSPSAALETKPRAILLSSDAFETTLLKKARTWVPRGVSIVRIYHKDIAAG